MTERKNEVVLQLDPGDDNPRNSEGSFLSLLDGRIVFAYTHFMGSKGSDDAPAFIAARYSSDDGRTWTPKDEVMVPNVGDQNVMSVSMLRLKDGRAMLGYIVKNGFHDCRLRVVFSDDDGGSWSEPVLAATAPGYFVHNNDRIVELSSGRLVAPMSFHRMKTEDTESWSTFDGRGILFYYLSDDGGESWREAKTWWALPQDTSAGIQEPGLVELKDGSLYSFLRTSTGRQWSTTSQDGGETWSTPTPTDFVSPTSPLSMKRLPNGDFLAIWNDHSGRFPVPKEHEQRSPLVSAISSDECRSWDHHKIIEDDPEGGFCYTAIHATSEDAVLLGYCAGSKAETNGILNRLRVRRIEIDWFYS